MFKPGLYFCKDGCFSCSIIFSEETSTPYLEKPLKRHMKGYAIRFQEDSETFKLPIQFILGDYYVKN